MKGWGLRVPVQDRSIALVDRSLGRESRSIEREFAEHVYTLYTGRVGQSVTDCQSLLLLSKLQGHDPL